MSTSSRAVADAPALTAAGLGAALAVGALGGAAPAAAQTVLYEGPAAESAAGSAGPSATAPPADSFTFAVMGHVRGNVDGPHYRLGEIIEAARRADPDLLFLAGDLIWGDVHVEPADSAGVEAQWATLDSALATLDVPVHRVPGNHDINDAVTRDIYEARYGLPPRVVDHGDVRFVLLGSGWIPERGEPGKHRHIRGVPLEPAQVSFLRRALDPSGPWRHAFVVMHHLLWWDEDAAWWDEVHPILREGRVRAVFSGDYGPMKFSHAERDGVHYFQTSIEGDPTVRLLRNLESSWLLTQQFDNYLVVRVAGPRVSLDVETLLEVSSRHYTPERWRAVNAPSPAEAGWGLAAIPGLLYRELRPPQIIAVGLTVGLLFLVGLGVGWWWGRRRAVRGRGARGS